MCGVTGFINPKFNEATEMQSVVRAMSFAIKHRGPDDNGEWIDIDEGIALGHRRLSILDLSQAGHQPMSSPNGRYVVAFNGELYNHLNIRSEIEHQLKNKISWRGHSDTETLAFAIEQFGIKKALQKFTGMFAIAIWNKVEKKLTLARDRFGEKPMYYGWIGDAFVFCSELKALKVYPQFKNLLDRESIDSFFQYSYIPSPRTIYKNIYKLCPASFIQVDAKTKAFEDIRPEIYWSKESIVRKSVNNLFNNEHEAIISIENSLSNAVRRQMISDVPFGAFLSGGIDSSLIVALMQSHSSIPINTFTVGFDQENFDESEFARDVAKSLGTHHNELRMQSSNMRDLIPSLPDMYDEPFADSSQLPTHLICKAAKTNVTVAVSGDGGDEIFGGYNRYLWAPRIWNKIKYLPYPIRNSMSDFLQLISSQNLEPILKFISVSRPNEKLQKLAYATNKIKSIDDLYLNLVSTWNSSHQIVLKPGGLKTGKEKIFSLNDPISKMMFHDTITYLPDDILCKVDRAAMAISLETRAPFLDHNVFEQAWRLPLNMKIRGNETKWILRKILSKYLPTSIIDRPKVGFSVPLGFWLRGPLKNWAEDLLFSSKIKDDGYLDTTVIFSIWNEHLSEKKDWSHQLWSILMFQSWLESNS